MTDFLRWLVIIEIIGIAGLPLSMRLCRALPDRGYAFARPLGLLLLTFVVWWIGTLAPVAGSPLVPALVLVAGGALSWAVAGRQTVRALAEVRRVVLVEEAIFLVALAGWTLMRAFVLHPGIGHTEQYMDLTFLQGSLRSVSYPPYDPWMSGHAINYYYFGYLMYATAIKLTGLPAVIGYNLALSTVAAFTLSGAYAVVYAGTRRLGWSLLGPVFVGLLGNWYPVLTQLPAGHGPATFNWFWDSTRVVGGDSTINEFPYFSFLLGDLHPHVMALPVTILAIGLAAALLMDRQIFDPRQHPFTLCSLIPAALVAGSLYAMNSWDFPTYLLVICAALTVRAYLSDPSERWWQAPAIGVPFTAALAVVAFLPFYLRFKSPAHGFGFVTTPSNLGQFVEVFGLFLLCAAVLLLAYGLLLQPASEDDVPQEFSGSPALEVGAVRISDGVMTAGAGLAIALILGLRWQLWTFDLLLALAIFGAIYLWRVLNTEQPNRGDAFALLLLIIGCLVVASTEIIYLRDQFDGGPNYRMNTVFKFYYQGWTLLGLTGAYAAYRAFGLLRRILSPAAGTLVLGMIAAGALAAAVYTVEAPRTANWGGTAGGLNGESMLASEHPSDAQAIDWLRGHVSGNPVTLEAGNGKDYDAAFGRVAAFTGLPTVMGWAGHEYQWRGNDPEIGMRATDVNEIYGSGSRARTEHLLRQYGVRYVFVGDAERQVPGAQPEKFAHFMRVAYRAGTTTIYTW